MAHLDEEMRRFEMELAGSSVSAPLSLPGASQPPQPQPSISSGPVRFIPHQLMRPAMTRPGMGPPRPPIIQGAPQMPNFAYPSVQFPPMMPPLPPTFTPMSAPLIGANTGSNRPQAVPSSTPQVSANKAMLDAQKAMAMQQKDPLVMGPQVTPKHIQDAASTKKAQKKMKFIRTAGGEIWQDFSLAEWDPNDYRIFCGDLGNEVNDDVLARVFRKYPSFQKAKVVRDKKSNKSKGYGFVSFKDPADFVRAMKEMNGKYVGNRPIKLRKSCWKDRQIDVAKKRVKEKQKLGMR